MKGAKCVISSILIHVINVVWKCAAEYLKISWKTARLIFYLLVAPVGQGETCREVTAFQNGFFDSPDQLLLDNPLGFIILHLSYHLKAIENNIMVFPEHANDF